MKSFDDKEALPGFLKKLDDEAVRNGIGKKAAEKLKTRCRNDVAGELVSLCRD